MDKSLEMQERILGAYIRDPDVFVGFENLVRPNIFTTTIYKKSYEIIKACHASKRAVDVNILFNALKKTGVAQNKAAEIVTIGSDYVSKDQVKEYVNFLFEEYVGRYLTPILTNAITNFSSGNILEEMDKVKNAITEVELAINNVSKEKDILDIADAAIKEIELAKESTSGFGHPSGVAAVDKITGGFYPGVFVIGARPGMGKTSFLVNIIKRNAIDSNIPVVFFSLEMPATQVIKTLMANIYTINSFAIKTGQLDNEEMERIKTIKTKLKTNLIIDDTPGITHQYVDSRLRAVRKKFPLDQTIVVMIDYMQLTGCEPKEAEGRNDESVMTIKCNAFNKMWKVHNACIIELSQLSRQVENRDPPRPKISDLKESGSLEANADVIMLLYRPDYYDKNPTDENGNDLRGLVEVAVPKNRHGRTGYAYAKFTGKYSKFEDRPAENGINTESEETF